MKHRHFSDGNSAHALTGSFTGTLTALIVAGWLAGCAAGPDFVRPTAPDVPAYTAAPLPAQTVAAATTLGDAQHFGVGASVSAQWWRAFGSPKLVALIEQSLQASPTLAAAQASLRQAEETHAAQAGSTLHPQVGAGIGAQRQRLSPGALGQAGEAREFSVYNASIGAHYQLDLAGGNRRTLESLAARTDYRRHELDGVRLNLAGSIITAAIMQARLAAQADATAAILDAQEEQLHLTRERLRLGQASEADVLALQAQVESTRAGLLLLRKQLQQSAHLLAILSGRPPGAKDLPTFAMADFILPSDLPFVLPAELVHRRPDIQGAEALLHAANAEYGVAVARLYPQLNISANLGSQALSTGALFGGGSAVWSLVGQLTQSLFDPGLPAAKRASLAAFDAAAANYRSVVLQALRNVADVLRAVENDAESLAASSAADAAAQGGLQSVQKQYALGAVGYGQLLIARQQVQQARINLIAAQAQRLADTVALHQAMGGGGS